jgi:thiol-disulfide isomerase/thioredoxin
MSKHFFTKPVAYLQASDFDKKGNIINPEIPINKPIVVMMHTVRCPHCINAMPEYQNFANMVGDNVFVCAIQADGTMKGEKELGAIWKSVNPEFRGFPDFGLFKNGKFVSSDLKSRNTTGLIEFSKL